MTHPVSRREALVLGLVGVGSLSLGVAGLASSDGGQARRRSTGSAAGSSGTGAAFAEPKVLSSSGGVLELDLRVAEATVAVAGGSARMLTYNGNVPGPTLHVRPGDTLRVRLANDLGQPTNLHTHGLIVSAEGNSDNPFVEVGPGESFEYEITLPGDHPHGAFWYHPHQHGFVADQVFAGLYGAIVVDTDDWSAGAPRVVVVSDVTLAGGTVASVSDGERLHGRVGEHVLTNGLAAPLLSIAPGSTERLLIINACVSRYLDLGGLPLTVRGIDSGAFDPPRAVDQLLLMPGNRADVVIGAPSKSTALVARAYHRGAGEMGMMSMSGGVEESDATILTLVPDAAAVTGASAPMVTLPRDLRGLTVDKSRTVTLGMAMGGGMSMGGGASMGGGMSYVIDGRSFDPSRIDKRVEIGTVEEWTLVNSTMMEHPFHLHVWPMQLVDAEGVDVRDVVNVPAGESVTVRIAFDRFPGTTVYHCHILDHEDLGMMGVIEAS